MIQDFGGILPVQRGGDAEEEKGDRQKQTVQTSAHGLRFRYAGAKKRFPVFFGFRRGGIGHV